MKFTTKYHIDDYKDAKFNYLTVLRESDVRAKDGSPQWEFVCVCGAIIASTPSRVITGRKKSCGCMRYKVPHAPPKNLENFRRINPDDYIGRTNESLTVIGVREPEGKGRLQLQCRCNCGNITYVYPYQFNSGDIKSCGCARFGHSDCHKGNTSRRTHGLSKDPFYKKWNDMIRRCYNPNEPAYRFYGALGIDVCEEWRDTPEIFIEWCKKTHPGNESLSLDRIDGSKGYSPDNCRWSTQIEQVHNLKNNRFITIDGETRCITEWCIIKGISAGTVYNKVHNGMTFDEAILSACKNKKK